METLPRKLDKEIAAPAIPTFESKNIWHVPAFEVTETSQYGMPHPSRYGIAK